MDFYYLNFVPAFSSPILLRTQFEEYPSESRTNHFCPNHGVHLSRRVSSLRPEIRWQSQCAAAVVLESVSGHGLCPIDLSPQSSRYRSLFESSTFQALSLRLQSPHPTLHSGRRQRAARLENLRRFCSYPDRHRSSSVRGHRSWIGSGSYCLCPGCYHYRSVSECFPLGHLQASQGSHQASHIDGSPQLHSRFYRHYSRQSPRHSFARCHCPRARLFSGDGSGLHRFCSSVCPSPSAGFLCRTRQTKLSVPPSLFPNCGPLKRSKKRPNRFTHGTAQSKDLSRPASKSQLLLRTNRSIPGLFNQQLLHRSADGCGPLPLPLANRTVLQMDQATPKNQTLLWHFTQQRQESNLDCRGRLRAHCHHQKEAWSKTKSLHDPSSLQPDSVREKLDSLP